MQLSNNSTLLTSYLYYKSTFYSYLYNNKYVSHTTYYSYLHRVFKTTVAKNYDFDIYNVKIQRKKINQS